MHSTSSSGHALKWQTDDYLRGSPSSSNWSVSKQRKGYNVTTTRCTVVGFLTTSAWVSRVLWGAIINQGYHRGHHLTSITKPQTDTHAYIFTHSHSHTQPTTLAQGLQIVERAESPAAAQKVSIHACAGRQTPDRDPISLGRLREWLQDATYVWYNSKVKR